MYYFAAVMIIIVLSVAFAVFAQDSNDGKNVEFLKSYGWEVSGKSIEQAEVIIPEPFDLVYENYNKLQLEAGLDLRLYMGKHGMRYTYIVENYPQEVGESVRANVIMIDGEPVGGDICTVSINGFMHSLNFPENGKTAE